MCLYLEQNYKALRRYLLLRRTLVAMGIEADRLHLAWASAAEGIQLAREITEMVERVRSLGPLNWHLNGDQVQIVSDATAELEVMA